MNKPIKPIEPLAKDYSKDEKHSYARAYFDYVKALEKYQNDLELYEQEKLFKDVKRMNLNSFLKKYRIVKIR